MKQSEQIQSLLDSLNSSEDIKSFDILEEYTDEDLQCALVIINGLKIEFGHYDQLGFLYYWKDSKLAFDDLKEAIQVTKEMFEEDED